MISTQQVVLLVLQAVACVSILSYLAFNLLKAREEGQKYKLYSLRDRLLFFVASGELAEGNLVFKVFYQALNASIAELKTVNIFSLLRASRRARRALEKEERETLVGAINRSSTTVQEWVNEFTNVMMQIVVSNSFWLKVLLIAAKHCHDLLHKTRTRFSLSSSTYDTYRYFEALHASA